MIDTIEQKKVIKRNLILLAVIILFFLGSWIYVVVETRELSVLVMGWSSLQQEWVVEPVKNPFTKHVLVKCGETITEYESMVQEYHFRYGGPNWHFSVQGKDDVLPEKYLVYGEEASRIVGGQEYLSSGIPMKINSLVKICVDLVIE